MAGGAVSRCHRIARKPALRPALPALVRGDVVRRGEVELDLPRGGNTMCPVCGFFRFLFCAEILWQASLNYCSRAHRNVVENAVRKHVMHDHHAIAIEGGGEGGQLGRAEAAGLQLGRAGREGSQARHLLTA